MKYLTNILLKVFATLISMMLITLAACISFILSDTSYVEDCTDFTIKIWKNGN